MKKRIIAGMMVCLMAVASLAGCGNTEIHHSEVWQKNIEGVLVKSKDLYYEEIDGERVLVKEVNYCLDCGAEEG